MRFPRVIAILSLFALALTAAGELGAQTAPLGPAAGCRIGPDGRKNMGMDWRGEPHRRDLGDLVPRLESFLDDWTILPKRLIEAFWWGGFYFGLVSVLGLEAIAAFIWLLVRKR